MHYIHYYTYYTHIYITGESLPKTMRKLDLCMMGSTIVRGEEEVTVKYTGVDTFLGEIEYSCGRIIFNNR